MGLFVKKSIEALQAEANATGNKTLKRVLGPWSLVALGVGAIIGAGLFSITGTVALFTTKSIRPLLPRGITKSIKSLERLVLGFLMLFILFISRLMLFSPTLNA